MKSNRINLAQIGAGRWGANIIRNLMLMDRANLGVVCDINSRRREAVAGRWPVRVEPDLERVLADKTIDAVIIATPASYHFRHVMAALEASKHVLVEKPMANSHSEAIIMTERAEQLGLKLMVGHIFLYNDVVRDIKERIDAGELGDIRQIHSRRLDRGWVRADSDVLWTLGPHDVSIANFWLGRLPERVEARRAAHSFDDSPDRPMICFAKAEYSGGPTAHFHLSWMNSFKERRITVIGSEKILVYDDTAARDKVRIFEAGNDRDTSLSAKNPFDFSKLAEGGVEVPQVNPREPLNVEIQYFVDCLLEDRQPFTDGRHGAEVVAVLEAMANSMVQNGRTVTVPSPRYARPAA